MQLDKYLQKENILILSESKKKAALKKLIDIFVSSNPKLNRKDLEKAIFSREKQMSTGIGNGIAVPHVRLDSIQTPLMAIGINRKGIPDYESLDETPIHIIIMIVAPAENHEAYLKLLSLSADVLKQQDLRERIIASDDPGEICGILVNTEE